MSREHRAARRGRNAARPRAEALESRALLTSAVGPMVNQSLNFFTAQTVYSQRSTSEVSLSLTRQDSRSLPVKGATVGHPARPSDPLTVRVTTEDPSIRRGTAVPGVQYRPIDQTVTFLPGETTKSINVPIVAGAPNPGSVTVDVVATSTTPRTSSGVGEFTLVDRADVAAPSIVAARLVPGKDGVKGIALTFNEPMDPATVTDLRNYAIADTSKSKVTAGDVVGFLFLGRVKGHAPKIALRAASYDSASRTVTLLTTAPLSLDGIYQVRNAQAPSRLLTSHSTHPPRPIADTSGNLLATSVSGAASASNLFSVTVSRKGWR